MTVNIKKAQTILGRMKKKRILVVGDLMLDRYIYGSVNRISPEAPVPVVAVSHENSMPGGASNVAWNIQALGAKSAVAGIVGRDATGAELAAILKKGGVSCSGLVAVPRRRTTVKMRIVAERQQVVRVDFEDPPPLTGPALDALTQRVAAEVRKADGIIIEDYGKGVISQRVVDVALAAAAQRRIPVGLDPKDDHDLKFPGVSVATPNRKEAFAIAGVKDSPTHPEPLKDRSLLNVGGILLEKWSARMVIVTLGPMGMLLVGRGGLLHHVPTRAREVYDVSGAGDTVIAACVTALACGASEVEAAELANYAAGVVVGKLGTATCSPDELLAAIKAGNAT